MLPAIFNENLFDNFFDDDFYMPSVFGGKNDPLYGKHAKNVMKTDVRETDNSYELDIDLPGFKKEDIKVDLDGDVLTVSAERNKENEEKDNKGNYLRRERVYGSVSRSFDVSSIKTEEIKVGDKDGVLSLTLPKKTSSVPVTRRLEIE